MQYLFKKIAPFMRYNVEKYGGAREATNHVTMWRCLSDKQGYMRTRSCTQSTNLYYLVLFHGNNDSRSRLSVTLHYLCCQLKDNIIVPLSVTGINAVQGFNVDR